MRELVKSPLAENDLKRIWHYTNEKWGASKATEYLLALDKGMKALIDNPKMGQPRDYIRRGYRSIQINRHVVYYRLNSNIIDVVRVLHERMSADTHL